MYVTAMMSPLTTVRSPGAEKAFSENSVPVVPPLVLLETRNAPPTVPEVLMLKLAGVPELVTTEGLALVAAVSVGATRVELL